MDTTFSLQYQFVEKLFFIYTLMIMPNLCQELLMKYIIYTYFAIEFTVLNSKYIVVYSRYRFVICWGMNLLCFVWRIRIDTYDIWFVHPKYDKNKSSFPFIYPYTGLSWVMCNFWPRTGGFPAWLTWTVW